MGNDHHKKYEQCESGEDRDIHRQKTTKRKKIFDRIYDCADHKCG